jgi:hypothetical protein
MVVVVAHVGSAVSGVDASFGDGATDSMAPSGGWVVLADEVPATTQLGSGGEPVTLVATASDGTTLETTSVASEPAYAVPSSCVYPNVTAPDAGPGAAAGGTASSGSAR